MDFAIGDAISKVWTYIRFNGTLPVADVLAVLKLVPVGIVVGNYFVLFFHVGRIISQTNYITGRQLTNGPLYNLGVEIWFLMIIFIIDVVQKSAPVSQ